MTLLAGLDPQLLARLPRVDRRRLGRFAAATLVSAWALGLGAGAFGWLATDSWWVGATGAVVGAASALNLLRLVMAGSAHRLHDGEPWSPTWPPIGVVALVALLLSQPILVLVSAAHPSGGLDRVRGALVAMQERQVVAEHERALAERRMAAQETRAELDRVREALQETPSDDLRRREHQLDLDALALAARIARMETQGPAIDLEAYRAHASRSNLFGYRARFAWTHPEWAVPITAVWTALGCGSLLLRIAYRDSLKAYLDLRRAVDLAAVGRHTQEIDAPSMEALQRWRRQRPRVGATPLDPAYLDAPYNTQRAPSLRPGPGDARERPARPPEELLADVPTPGAPPYGG